jgi:tRNA-specific 2-thiouridylase
MKIAHLLSGGVDSSVALRLLLEPHASDDICAFYLKIWLEDELSYLGDCPWEEDLKFARAVCEQAGVKLEVVPLQTEYREKIVSYVTEELKLGRTPSPDVLCNQRIKFGAFWDKVSANFDKISSGHYATVVEDEGIFKLQKGIDPVKDQSYFLSHMSQAQIAKCIFPLGSYMKTKVRELAHDFDLINKDRADSQGICFLGKIKYDDFVKFHLKEKKGDIVEIETNKILGAHNGYWFHTIGQRKGLGLSGGPWFVVKKDIDKNIIYVSHKEKAAEISASSFAIEKINWISGEPSSNNLKVKVRHGANMYSCVISHISEGILRIDMDQKDLGLALGQFAVLYDGEICLGGGVICSIF